MQDDIYQRWREQMSAIPSVEAVAEEPPAGKPARPAPPAAPSQPATPARPAKPVE